MKKILYLFVFTTFATNSFADKIITVTISGDKTGSTKNVDGSVSLDCSDSDATCGVVRTISSSAQEYPLPGDPTELDTYVHGQIDAVYTGNFVSMTQHQNANNSITLILQLQNNN
jgi:hypothetical protein